MARTPKLIDIKGASKEALRRHEEEAVRRDAAARILSPDQIQGKNWRATKVLLTTLGIAPGEKPRRITKSDLLAFNANMKALKSRVETGVTAKEIMSMSTDDDKKRARLQIHMAVPVNMKGGKIHFMTNAGPDSKVRHHHVHVVLDKYESGLANGTPLQAAKALAQSNLKFDCDCEHHTYVFRYITTLMGANAGRAETGFPKIRNPQLEGIACKHVLRVMAELDTSIFVQKRIAEMVRQDRERHADKTRPKRQTQVSMTQKEANELAHRQAANPRELAAIRKAVESAPPPANPKKLNKAQIHFAANVLAEAWGISYEEALKRIGNNKP